MRALILIPARYASSRFPGKPLAKISGISMIQRVYQNCEKTGFDTYVVTDDSRIEEHVKSFGNVVRIDDDVPSGTERINLAYQRHFSERGYDFVVNVQGDEPLLEAADLIALCEYQSQTTFNIATVVKERDPHDSDLNNPNIVKAVFCEGSGQCLYFSRSAVPYDRDQKDFFNWFQHIGVYSFRSDDLARFGSLSPSILEGVEKLEQLRALENGMTIGAIKTDKTPLGVDTPQDITRVEEVLNEKKSE
jgi:3-deoxy-manno-octulosonate cytidylyltransferase (CMP-KDO synthetase)